MPPYLLLCPAPEHLRFEVKNNPTCLYSSCLRIRFQIRWNLRQFDLCLAHRAYPSEDPEKSAPSLSQLCLPACLSMSQFSDDLDPNSTLILFISLLSFPISLFIAFLGHLSFAANTPSLPPKNVPLFCIHILVSFPPHAPPPPTLVQMSLAGANLWTELSILMITDWKRICQLLK